MKSKLFFSLFALIALSAFSQKIAGYLPSYRDPSIIQYNKLTHVIYCFVNPNSTGNLVGINTPNINNAVYDFNMNNFIIAKSNCYPQAPNGPKLIISVGGADAGNVRSTNLNSVCGNATYRATMISQLVSFAIQNDLYGIDIDWEFPVGTTAKNNHELLLSDLRTAINGSLKPSLKIGIAIGGETTGGTNHTQYLNPNAIQYVDDFNLMAYDLPSTYHATNHADLSNMTALINNWNTFGIPKAKMVLGVPFYGRNAARTAVSDYKDFTAGLSGATLTTAFTGDGATGGYYYNGKTTLEAKVDLIMNTHCGQGIMIWDLGGDRTDAYSLLTPIYDRMNVVTACTFPKPTLGTDVSACGASTTLTVTNISAASGRSFIWKRNGATQATTSANNYAVSQGGEWSVTVSESCCNKSDDIMVAIANTVSATGATRCGTGTLTLNMVSTGATYDWYDASTLGKYLASGSAFTTPSISTTTTYYVQQNAGTSTFYTAKPYPTTFPQKEYADYGGKAHWANKFIVNQTLTIQSVDVYYSGPAITGARLVAYSSADGLSVDYQSTPVNFPAQSSTPIAAGFPVTMTTSLTLPPGTYYMGIYAPGADAQGANPGVTLDPNGVASLYTSTYFSLDGKAYVNWGGGFNATGSQGANYGQLFNWVITVNNRPCTRTSVQATINCPPTITLTSPAEPGPVTHNVGIPITLTVSASDDGSVSGVVYEIREVATNNLVTTLTGGAAPSYSVSWTPSSSIQYKIRATATDNTSLTSSTPFVILDVALPVDWLGFDAVRSGETVLLNWSTINEENNAYFRIERSSDGVHFYSIGTVNGAGTSINAQYYNFVDAQPLPGYSYYRIVQVDGDLQTSSSSNIDMVGPENIQVYPNPFNSSTQVYSDSEVQILLQVYTLEGLLVEEKYSNGNEVTEIGALLPSGVYQLVITGASQRKIIRMEKIE